MISRNLTGRDREKVLFFYLNAGSSHTPSPDDCTSHLFDRAELVTVLAALTVYKNLGYGDPGNRPIQIHDIAAPNDVMSSLDEPAIIGLIERLQS